MNDFGLPVGENTGFPAGPEPVRLDEVNSTNTYVRDNFAAIPDGALVTAFRQTAGRGRCGRVWTAPPGRCVTATARLAGVGQGFHAGALLGLAALDLIRDEVPGVRAYFKWPNDLYVRDCKLAGMLSEGVISGGRLIGVAAGIGLNVNLSARELRSVGRPATSLEMLAKRRFNVENLAERLARRLFRYYIIYQQCSETILRRWRGENRLVGQAIEVVDPGGRVYRGVFREVASDGALVLDVDGDGMRFNCGDVRIQVDKIDFDRMFGE